MLRVIEFFRVHGKDRFSNDAETITPRHQLPVLRPTWWPSPLQLADRPMVALISLASPLNEPGAPSLVGRRGCSIVTGAWSGDGGLARAGSAGVARSGARVLPG